jgi:hypothetical protein
MLPLILDSSAVDPWSEILGALGWAGILAAALSYVFKSYVKSVDERIDSLERRAGDCEADRRSLHQQMRQILMKGHSEEILG